MIKTSLNKVLTLGRRVNTFLWPNCHSVLLALPIESKLSLVILWTSTKKRPFVRAIAAYHAPGDALISSKDTTSGAAAVTGVTT